MPNLSPISRTSMICWRSSSSVSCKVAERRTGKLHLAAGLKTNDAALGTIGALQRDDVAPLEHAVPTETVLHAFEQRPDAALAVIRDRRMSAPVEAELLVLGADAPFADRLRACFEIGDELVPRLDGRALRPSYACRHGETISFLRLGFEGRMAPLLARLRGGEHGMDQERQSPRVALTSANAATAAVSARITRGPSEIGRTKG